MTVATENGKKGAKIMTPTPGDDARAVLRQLGEEVFASYPDQTSFVTHISACIRRDRGLTAECIRISALELYRRALWDQRTTVVENTGKQPQRKYDPDLVKRVASKAEDWIQKGSPYAFPLWGGTMLGDATVDDLIKSRDHWCDLATESQAKADFVSMVETKARSKGISSTQKIKEVLDENVISGMMKKVFGK